ncbi:ABC transporter permease [Methanococcoides orientis]|uniref:ABC transporter permease n=1 Tax=Methanococcoides orientis TaxID=2822137 RepID=UPI001E61F223|nr:ABC transporter permease [Methanococcoides orientis]UGV41661.1 ABC transporter permease [Methanococcoides orientis]
MKPAKILKISLNMVKANKLRSWLTIIGVIIGIASVMTVVTTGEFFQDQVTKTLEGFGGDTITIVASTPFQIINEEEVGVDPVEDQGYNEYLEDPDMEAQAKLTKKDVLTLERIPEVEYINVKVESSALLDMSGEETSVWISGVDPKVWEKMTTENIAEGRMLKSGDRNVVVISDSLANEAFKDKKIRLNQMIVLNERSYRVVGILAKGDGLLGGISSMFGSSVYMSCDDVYGLQSEDDVFAKEEGVYDSIEVMLYEGSDVNAVLDDMDKKLKLSRRVDEDTKDFYISSQKEIMEGTNKLITGLTAFLAFIAGISLLVGSVGIANTMFTSVLEKTKEIGIMKAIGARNEDILMIFLCNAALIGLVGGLLGILLGTAIVQVIVFLISMQLKIPFIFTLSLKATAVATIVSIGVGLVAGLMPAKNASKLNPVDALRYE